MSRRRQDVATVRISDEEYSRLESKFEALKNEFAACRRKLDSKCEALLILSQELDQCRSERDQFKLMAEQLRERCQTLKRSLSGKPKQSLSDTGLCKNYTDTQTQNIARLLYEAKEVNKSLQFEVDDLKQKLYDAQGDIKLLREQIARSRVGTTDEGMNTRHFPAHEREELVQKLESSNEQYLQLERDLQTVLDEKEELVTERDVYKTKYERLNQELNYILKGDENRVVDIDALVMENKYLQERLKQMEEEKSMAMAAVSKYKNLLERKKTKSSMKLGQSRGAGLIITQKQVQQVLDSKQSVLPTQQAMSDLQALAGALLDSVNDKNLALSHQRKTNKILGNRVAELEKKIKTLECAGLWNIPTNISSSLEKLKQDCDDVKMLIPRKHSTDSEKMSTSEGDRESELESVTPLDSADTSPDPSPQHTANPPASHLDLKYLDKDLDLLPTKEISQTKSQRSSNDKFHLPSTEIQVKSSIVSQLPDCDVNGVEDFRLDKDSDTEGEGRDNYHAGKTISEDIAEHIANDLAEESESVHVYNQDKIDESQTCNSDDAHDNSEDFKLTERREEDENEGVINNSEDLDEFYDDNDEEASAKVGLLMESVTKKMCNISHQSTENKSQDRDQHASSTHDLEADNERKDCVKPRNIRKERDTSLSGDQAGDGQSHPLLGSEKKSLDESSVSADEPRDIEC